MNGSGGDSDADCGRGRCGGILNRSRHGPVDSENGRGRHDAAGNGWAPGTLSPQAGHRADGTDVRVIAGDFLFAGFWMTFSGVYKSATYLPVAATVDTVKGIGPEADSVTVTYSYQVDGQRYTGSKSADEESKAEFGSLRQYKPGQPLTVYRHPADPRKSEITIAPHAYGLAFAIFALPFLAIGVSLLWLACTGRELVCAGRPPRTAVPFPAGLLAGPCGIVCRRRGRPTRPGVVAAVAVGLGERAGDFLCAHPGR